MFVDRSNVSKWISCNKVPLSPNWFQKLVSSTSQAKEKSLTTPSWSLYVLPWFRVSLCGYEFFKGVDANVRSLFTWISVFSLSLYVRLVEGLPRLVSFYDMAQLQAGWLVCIWHRFWVKRWLQLRRKTRNPGYSLSYFVTTGYDDIKRYEQCHSWTITR